MAVLNLQGELYRVNTIYTPAAAMAFLDAFERRGLFNRIQTSLCSSYDVDVLTDERYEGPFTWVLQVGMQAVPLPGWPYG